MSVRPIVMLGDPRLRMKGKPVDSFGKYLHELLDDLAHTMRDAPGVGLAAPQLGEPRQACVIEVERQLYELVNPRIVRSEGDGSGGLGRALQHELDHRDGKRYIDYLDSMDELLPVGHGDEDEAEVREAARAL